MPDRAEEVATYYDRGEEEPNDEDSYWFARGDTCEEITMNSSHLKGNSMVVLDQSVVII